MTIVTTVLCWLNASPATEGPKSTKLWLSPVNPTPLMPEGTSVFVNLPRRQSQKRLADFIRSNFGTESYQMLLDFTQVVKSENGFLSIQFTDWSVLKESIIRLSVAPETTADAAEDEFFADFSAPAQDAATESDDDFAF